MINKKIHSRLNRVQGQVAGLSKMITEGTQCSDVFTQFKATKSALESAMRLYLEEYANECVKKNDTVSLKEIIKEVTKH